ncbi:MAG: hypothetical protein ABI652_04365 [Acidobacteriota bacterium]
MNTRPLLLTSLFVGALLLTPLVSLVQPTRVEAIAGTSLLSSAQDDVTVVLSNPSVHSKVGMPDVLYPATDPELGVMAKTLTDVLWNDIDFEREYYMIPRTSSAKIPAAAVESLPFDQWSELGADFVLVATARRNGADVAVDVRLVAVKTDVRGKQAFAKEYSNCAVANPRYCAHSIADDFHKTTRRLDGVARTKLAFTSDRDAARMPGRPASDASVGKEIYRSDYDGASPMRLTVNRTLNLSPAWSPVGGFLAYTSYQSGNADIYLANLAEPGRGFVKPAHGGNNIDNQSAAWSPDGTKLAFSSNRSGNNEIWVVNADGTALQNLTNFPAANDWAPTWSPSGAQIAFASDRAGQKQLYVMSASGTAVQRLVDREIDRPTWSRLNFIAFTMASGPGYDIALYDFSSRAIRVLTDGVGKNESPAVAPNGRHVAFVTTRWGKSQIAIVDMTGETKTIRRITEAGNNTYPTWGPIPGGG